VNVQFVEPQYAVVKECDREQLGLMINHAWQDDPKRLAFTFARYKFVAKMLAGKGNVLEVGCADAFGTRIVQQQVDGVTVCDIDPVFIKDVQDRINPRWPLRAIVHDMLSGPIASAFEAVFALDVLEHIEPEHEDTFLANMAASLRPHGIAIIGMPSAESQVYASEISKAGHVNCKTGEELRALMERHFWTVLMFGQNDEVVHTGFSPMCQYRFAIGCDRK
jgi:2-polyprenyl-3-methyl-5-hydroxy-6-metoxy-1,4-benzoquinol methylase